MEILINFFFARNLYIIENRDRRDTVVWWNYRESNYIRKKKRRICKSFKVLIQKSYENSALGIKIAILSLCLKSFLKGIIISLQSFFDK